mgnify:CR=1 FL=1
MIDNSNIKSKEKALLIGVIHGELDEKIVKDHLDELCLLAITAGAEVVGNITQKLSRINPSFFIGTGKAEQIISQAEELGVSLIIFDDELSPAQVKNYSNLEKDIKVIDRSALILDIFRQHAQTKEAQTQVELALAVQQDDILKLESAIKIAKELNIRKPTTMFGEYNVVQITPPASFFVAPNKTEPRPYIPNNPSQNVPLYNIGAGVSPGQNSVLEQYSPPLYSRGWQALELELGAIKQRKDIDAYIPNMRRLLISYNWLGSRQIDANSINPMRISKPATLPGSKIGWNRLNIIVMATLLGALAGIILPLLAYLASHRDKQN